MGVGYTRSNYSGIGNGTAGDGGYDFMIAEFSSDLQLQNIYNFGGSSDDFFYDLVYDGSHFYAV